MNQMSALSQGTPSSIAFLRLPADAVLQQLVETTERQQKEIQAVRSVLGGSADYSNDGQKEPFYNKLTSIEAKLDLISKRVRAIEEAIRIPGSSSMTVGQGVAANRRTLARSLDIISTKADNEQIKKQLSEQSVRLNKNMDELRRHCVHEEIVEKMNEAIAAISSRVDALSMDVGNKIDRSSFATVAADASAIRNHSAFVRETRERMSAIENDSTLLLKKSDIVDDLSDRIIPQLQGEINTKASLDGMRDLAASIVQLGAKLDDKADVNQVTSLTDLIREHGRDLKNTERNVANLQSAQCAVAQDHARRLDGTYSRKEMDERLDRLVRKEKFHEILCELRDSVNAKAWEASLEGVERVTENLVVDMGTMKKKVELVIQFVDWYSKGGEAYEHNLRAVDLNLKKLASEARIGR